LGANNSVSEAATASTHGLVLQKVTYDSQMMRTAGSTCRSSSISSRGTLEGHAEPDPELDAAGARLGAVVVHDALQPFAPHVGVGAVGEDRSILSRYHPLVCQTVGGPALELPRGQPAGVHELVEGVLDVV
jgi:hypothetical protein